MARQRQRTGRAQPGTTCARHDGRTLDCPPKGRHGQQKDCPAKQTWNPASAVLHPGGQTYISDMQFDPTNDSRVLSTTSRSAVLIVLPSIMLPMFLAVVDQTIVATALPVIGAATGNVQRVSWIVVGYLIASTIAAVIYGRLA